LALLADHLVEIHGQAANHQIVKPARQRELLDRFIGGDLSKALLQYQENFNGYNELKARIKAMRESVSKRDSQIAELQEFSSAWIKLKAVRGEVASTNDQISRLSSVEDLRVAADGATQAITNEEEGSLTSLGAARRYLDVAKGKDGKLDEISSRIAEGFFLIDDAARDLASYLASLEADPGQLDTLQARKAELASFLKKWGSSAEPDEDLVLLAAKAKSAKTEIEDLTGGDERIAELEKELGDIKKKLLSAAEKLTQVRAAAI
jgi:DNA repair protein RecN (Recombination protein N)